MRQVPIWWAEKSPTPWHGSPTETLAAASSSTNSALIGEGFAAAAAEAAAAIVAVFETLGATEGGAFSGGKSGLLLLLFVAKRSNPNAPACKVVRYVAPLTAKILRADPTLRRRLLASRESRL
jgi:hypothetical protein